MSVAIIDYGSGNLHSAAKAFERAARDHGLAVAVEVTADPAVLRRAVFPEDSVGQPFRVRAMTYSAAS